MDACEICFGTKGGVPGNEIIVPVPGTDRVTVMCDYCHAEYLWWEEYEKRQKNSSNC